MNVSDKGLESLKQAVGFRARPYQDSLGNTIIGHNHVVVPGDGVAPKDIINAVKAKELFLRDVKQIVNNLNVTSSMTQEEFDALVINKFKTQ